MRIRAGVAGLACFTVRDGAGPRSGFVNQRKLSVTADTYTHVMPDSREAYYEEPLTA